MTTNLRSLLTPCLLLDEPRFRANVERMRARMAAHGVALRPHMKTAKSLEVADRVGGNTMPITVSTLSEARYFCDAGYTDVMYAVGVTPDKLAAVAELNRIRPRVTLILDSLEAARSVVEFSRRTQTELPVAIEIDSDGHRCGLAPDEPAIFSIATLLNQAALLRGVMTHAGGSYDAASVDEIRRYAEEERRAVVSVANALRAREMKCELVSVGSTPTAIFGASFEGVTEVRAGVYMFFDLVMAGLGVCALEEIALSVLCTVIGHQRGRNWIITDAGWTALSRDRGTQSQKVDQGYGVVCDESGRIVDDLIVEAADQEHGTIGSRSGAPLDFDACPIGSRLRILPNHACATAAQHDRYEVIDGDGRIAARWPRIGGW